ncbi:MAG: alkaline phosphatase family protein [Betaproteobacteria bacterium]|jgi:alkaline phosphatase D|nr:alkaline phosphatase family protein [Betaproteobacteria bacterium]OZB45574.1 MAG: phosphodiesterase [Thiomonas sp. 15-66-11]
MQGTSEFPALNRRGFLRTGLGAGALVAGGAWTFPAAWADPAPPGMLHAGPMQGYVAARSGVVWLQTPGAAEVFIDFAPQDQRGAKRRTAPVKTDAAGEFCAHIVLDDLTPGVSYLCQAYVNGQAVQGKPLRLRTQKIWLFRGPPPEFTVLTGSCAYINDPPFDRPGPPYGGGYEIYDAMRGEHADLMVWLGDNLYFREADLLSPQGMALRYRRDRAFAPLQDFLRSTPQVAIWDDHDYDPNDGDLSFTFKGESLRLFKRYWANPAYGLPEVAGVFTKVNLFDADFFLLDDRYWRDADASGPAERGKTMFGAEQLRWLKNALLFSRARFKIIAAGGQMLNDDDAYEGWNQYPVERAEFLGWLQQARIPGVVFLSGDRHITELTRYPRPRYGGKADYPLLEYTCSPLNSGPSRGDANPNRVPGTLVAERNYGVLRFTGEDKDRALEIITRDVAGTTLGSQRIEAGQLGWA